MRSEERTGGLGTLELGFKTFRTLDDGDAGVAEMTEPDSVRVAGGVVVVGRKVLFTICMAAGGEVVGVFGPEVVLATWVVAGCS